jgi:hypothetical protein
MDLSVGGWSPTATGLAIWHGDEGVSHAVAQGRAPTPAARERVHEGGTEAASTLTPVRGQGVPILRIGVSTGSASLDPTKCRWVPEGGLAAFLGSFSQTLSDGRSAAIAWA